MRSLLKIFSRVEVCRPLSMSDGPLTKKYRRFRTYLDHNRAALTALAEMEQMYYAGRPFTLDAACSRYGELFEAVLGAIYTRQALSNDHYSGLEQVFTDIDAAVEHDFVLRHAPRIAD